MVRLRDIAEHLGLDISVVSRALNPNPDRHAVLAEKTRQRILQAAREMGYRRNRAAEFLRRGQSAVIGVFLPEIADRLVADLMFGLSKRASETGFPLNFFFGETQSHFEHFLKESTRDGHSGIITYPYNPSLQDRIGKLIAGYRQQGGKVVVLNASVEYPDVCMLGIDQYHGGVLAAEHLREKGCRAYVYESSYIPERGQGFAETLNRYDIQAREFAGDGLLAALRRVVKTPGEAPLGVFLPTDKMAVESLAVLEALHLKVGRDVLLVGYDDQTLTDCLPMPLTTIHQPFQTLGFQAVDVLIRLIYGQPIQIERIVPRLVARASTEGNESCQVNKHCEQES